MGGGGGGDSGAALQAQEEQRKEELRRKINSLFGIAPPPPTPVSQTAAVPTSGMMGNFSVAPGVTVPTAVTPDQSNNALARFAQEEDQLSTSLRGHYSDDLKKNYEKGERQTRFN